jgi:hypothetical protein
MLKWSLRSGRQERHGEEGGSIPPHVDRSEEAAARVLASMDPPTFEEVARNHIDQIPATFRAAAVTALRKFIGETKNQLPRLRAALDLIEAGEAGLDDVVKGALAALRREDMRNAKSHYILPAVEHLHKTDPAWISEWLVVQIGEGVLYHGDHWLRFATTVPEPLVETYVQRLETEDLKNARFAGMIEVIASRSARSGTRTQAERAARDVKLNPWNGLSVGRTPTRTKATIHLGFQTQVLTSHPNRHGHTYIEAE